MAIDLNAVATAAIADIQTAINNLNAVRRQNGADVAGILVKIEALEQKQADLRTLALQSVENSPENQAAVKVVNAAATSLKSEAANITTVANALITAQQVIGDAADLFSALGKFSQTRRQERR